MPGGKAEPVDADATATALREAGEESASTPPPPTSGSSARSTRSSSRSATSGSRRSSRSPAGRRDLAPNPAEVARILTPPVEAFLPAAPVEIVERTIGDWPLRYGGYRIDGLHVWGATARILGQLGAVLAAESFTGD